MATVMFKKGLLAGLPSTYKEGTFYVTTDERAIYLDVSDSARIRLGDFQEFATLTALQANANPSTTALYYVADINCLAKWNGSEYIQINRDTGMTSVEVVGTGNAVTAAVYSADGRKLTLTKGATYVTASEVEAAIVAKTGDMTGYDNVKAYVDAKTEGVATDAALGELQSKVTAVEGEIDALQEQVGEGTVGSQIDAKIAALDLGNTYEPKGTGATEAGKVQAALNEYKEANDAAVEKVSGDLAGEIERAKVAEQAAASAAAAADTKAQGAQDAVDALADKVGTVPADKTVVQMIADAQTAATYDDTQVKADIKANSDAIGVLNGTGVGSVRKQIDDAINKFATDVTDDKVVNSYKELIDWVANHGPEAAEMAAAIDALEAILAGIGGDGEKATVKAYVDDAIAALKIGDYAKAADLTALAERVAAMEAKVSTWDAAEKNAKDYADGLNTAMNERVEALEAIDHEHDNMTVLNGITSDKVAAWDGAQANAEATAAAALAGAKTELEGKITAAQTAAEKVANDNNSAMDTRVKVLEGIDHNAYVGADAEVLADAKEYADGQVTAALTWGTF